MKHILTLCLLILLSACNIMRNVPPNRNLLVSNTIHFPDSTEVTKEEVKDVIRQRPNHGFLGVRLRLRMFNTIDSTKTLRDKKERYLRYREKNKRRLARQKKINDRRIKKALKRGDSLYKPKYVKLKDTLNPRPTIRERLKFGYGEPPVIFDSSFMKTSAEQIQLFMQQKGYLNAEVKTAVNIDSFKRTAEVDYTIFPYQKYSVDSIILKTKNHSVKRIYHQFITESESALHPPLRFDAEDLGEMRKDLSTFMKNHAIYGFRESYISYVVDTLAGADNVKVILNITDRTEGEGQNARSKPFIATKINKVTFHLLDTVSYRGDFYGEQLKPRNIKLTPYDTIPTYDTLRYNEYEGNNAQFREATFLYNGVPTTAPKLIEFQNFLEENNYYKEKFYVQSYNRLANLGIFKTVDIKLSEKNDSTINVDYYLTPMKHQSFSFEPKGTHNNSFFGVFASVNYENRNLFHQGYKLKLSFSGGFESQPEVFGKNNENDVLNDGTHSFNTLEFGPTVSLDIPGLVPFGLSSLSKRQNPITTFSASYKYQVRPEFKRQNFQLNYLWKFADIFHTQTFTVGIPVIGGIQFVNIDKSEAFKKRLQEQNDLFLINAYSNQAIYKDAMVGYNFTNPDLKGGDITFKYGFNFDMAGMFMSLFTKNSPINDQGYKEFLGQRYSQFIRLDNHFILHHKIGKKHSLHYRLQVGAGIPLKNNGLTLPYDYSFFAGGSNNNRGFRAQSLGPGVYKYYLDTNRTTTRMGDMRLSGTVEYRFYMGSVFEGALFVDAGNVWTYNNDPNRPGGQISNDFMKQLSISAGIGLRLDFTFLIVRADVGIPLRNPTLPHNAKWIFQSRQPYYQEGIDKWGKNTATGNYYYKEYLPNPFRPRLHIAIGYPF